MIGVGREVRGRRQDGAVVPLDLSVREVWLGGRQKFVGVLRDVTERKQAAAARDRLLRQLIPAQEDDRRRLARELHDGLGQALTTLRVGLHTVTASPTVEDARAPAGRMEGVAGDALEEVRRLAHGLRPAVLDDLGLVPAVERLAATAAGACGVAARLTAGPAPGCRPRSSRWCAGSSRRPWPTPPGTPGRGPSRWPSTAPPGRCG